jgi:selenide,water dikinase
MAPDALAQVLRPLENMFPPERFPQVLSGLGPLSDDAAVYKLSDELALIATLDFFTPIVDDPYQYGAIAAANALSDIYAMGGRVAFVLNISCLSECLPPEVIAEILRGGADKISEAGAVLVGGHSVDDKEPKYGLVALGFVHTDCVLTKAGARPGDVLVLTKPVGVGIVTTALKGDAAAPEHIEASVASMLKLNRAASELLQENGPHACTDVTGFALLGHAVEVAERSGVRVRIHAGQVPFVPGAEEYGAMWLFPAGTGKNRTAYRAQVQFAPDVAEATQHLLFTPETSGGLLAALPPERLGDVQRSFAAAGEPLWVIGEVAEGSGVEVIP